MSSYNKRPYLIISFIKRPNKDVKTELPKWYENEDSVDNIEDYSFATKVTDKQLVSASIIIDLLSKKIVKNRHSEYDENEIVAYYHKKYGDEIKRFVINYVLRNETRFSRTGGDNTLPTSLDVPAIETLNLDTSNSSMILGAE